MSSRYSQLKSQAHSIARASGSATTMANREAKLIQLAEYLRDNNYQISSFKNLKMKHIEGYIASRIKGGLSTGTLQNDMAAIRHALREVGKAPMADDQHLSNKALGIDGRSRIGTKTAMPADKYYEIAASALSRDQGLAACLELQRHLGLRAEEAIQGNKSLQTWANKLERSREKETSIRIVYGTKGGRARDVIIKTEAAREAIQNAAKVCAARGGKLIEKPTLKAAYHYYANSCRALGLTGQHSSHSLRYAYAQDCLRYYKKQGYNRREARALTSLELGHGDGRGRYIASVYGQKD